MTQEFIPYEQALELKELGFDEEHFGGWFEYKGKIELVRYVGLIDDWWDSNAIDLDIKAPLYQQAFRWFRDKKLSDASINRHGEADGGYSYRWEIVHEYGTLEERHFKMGYNTYEEAELACLNKLIEIVKQKNL
jgi:hypothetical protein